MADNNVIRVHGLTKRFGDHVAVDSLSMNIERGRIHGFLGPNGSGKTTSIRMMCGLLLQDAGTVDVLGMEVPGQAKAVRRHVGYMTQRFSMYEDLTVLENLKFLARVHGLRSAAARQHIDKVLETYRLTEFAGHIVGPMSGGQKRRIALAAAVLNEPELLILDEPTSEVDPNTRRDMWEHFFNLAETGVTLLVSTHLMDEAERCHHLTIMNQGRKVAEGSAHGLKEELPARVVLVDGPQVSGLVAPLRKLKGVLAVSQVGMQLRVLVEKDIEDPLAAVNSALQPGYSSRSGEAGIEDVFVVATQEREH